MYLWWSLCTLYLTFSKDVPLVECMYHVINILKGCTAGGVYVRFYDWCECVMSVLGTAKHS